MKIPPVKTAAISGLNVLLPTRRHWTGCAASGK
jgi:hypothetical protein